MEAEKTAQDKPTESIPLVEHAVIGALLKGLAIDVSDEALQEAEKVSLAANSANPVERLNGLFQQLQLRGVNATIMRWHRFDQSRLPALILLDDEWQMINYDDQQRLQVQDAQGQLQLIDPEQLSNNPLIWLRVPAEREQHSVFSLSNNIAAKMVLGDSHYRQWRS